VFRLNRDHDYGSFMQKVVVGCTIAVTIAASGIALSTEADARYARWAWSVGRCGADPYRYWYGPYAYSPYYQPLSRSWTDGYAPYPYTYPYHDAFYP
jgi:hypothetical protein